MIQDYRRPIRPPPHKYQYRLPYFFTNFFLNMKLNLISLLITLLAISTFLCCRTPVAAPDWTSAAPAPQLRADYYLPERYLFLDELLDRTDPKGISITCKHYRKVDGRLAFVGTFDFTSGSGQSIQIHHGGEHYFLLEGPGISKAIRFYWNDQDTQFIELREVQKTDPRGVGGRG